MFKQLRLGLSTSSVREELMSLIRAMPHDDEPREVYADWLMEQGDPRGEFIRVQLLLHREGASQRPDLYVREQELLAKYKMEWLRQAGIDAHLAPGGVLQAEFRRGFLWRVHIPERLLLQAHDALLQEVVQHMTIESSSSDADSPWMKLCFKSALLAQLESLTVRESRNQEGCAYALFLRDDMKLREFACNRLGKRSIEALGRCTWARSLMSISVHGDDSLAGKLTAIVDSLDEAHASNMESLSLVSAGLKDSNFSPIASAPVLRNLRRLVLDKNHLTGWSVRGLSQSYFCDTIEELSLKDNLLTHLSLSYFVEIGQFPKLMRLVLRGNELGVHGKQGALTPLRERFGAGLEL